MDNKSENLTIMNNTSLSKTTDSLIIFKKILVFGTILLFLLAIMYFYICIDHKVKDIEDKIEIQQQIQNEIQEQDIKIKQDLKVTPQQTCPSPQKCTTCEITQKDKDEIKKIEEKLQKETKEIINISAKKCHNICTKQGCDQYTYYRKERKCVVYLKK